MSIIYRRIDEAGKIVRDREDPSACGLRMTDLQSTAKSEKSEYQKAREHFSIFFRGKTAEELETQRKRLAYAQAAIGDMRAPCAWLKNQKAVYFWALAQSVELGIAREKLREAAAEQMRL